MSALPESQNPRCNCCGTVDPHCPVCHSVPVHGITKFGYIVVDAGGIGMATLDGRAAVRQARNVEGVVLAVPVLADYREQPAGPPPLTVVHAERPPASPSVDDVTVEVERSAALFTDQAGTLPRRLVTPGVSPGVPHHPSSRTRPPGRPLGGFPAGGKTRAHLSPVGWDSHREAEGTTIVPDPRGVCSRCNAVWTAEGCCAGANEVATPVRCPWCNDALVPCVHYPVPPDEYRVNRRPYRRP